MLLIQKPVIVRDHESFQSTILTACFPDIHINTIFLIPSWSLVSGCFLTDFHDQIYVCICCFPYLSYKYKTIQI